MTTEYTPETKDIREVWIYAQDMTFDEGDEVHGSEFDRWLQKVKADLVKEIILEVRAIPCWYPDNDPVGGEFDLDGESHRRFVLETLLAYGSKFF